MDRHLLLFGSGTHFAHGSLPDCVGMTLRTGGLNGTIQPYRIFVSEPQNDGPYEQRSKFTTNSQDESLYQNDKIFKEGKMVSTEYTKGHGIAGVEDDSGGARATDETLKNNTSTSNSVKETVHVVHINPYSEGKIENQSVKMSISDYEKKLADLSEQANRSGSKRPNITPEKATKKRKTHKFQLF